MALSINNFILYATILSIGSVVMIYIKTKYFS